ncbi:MAG: hypothetical protein AB7S57_20400 [Acetobacteraceae bacterium]
MSRFDLIHLIPKVILTNLTFYEDMVFAAVYLMALVLMFCGHRWPWLPYALLAIVKAAAALAHGLDG